MDGTHAQFPLSAGLLWNLWLLVPQEVVILRRDDPCVAVIVRSQGLTIRADPWNDVVDLCLVGGHGVPGVAACPWSLKFLAVPRIFRVVGHQFVAVSPAVCFKDFILLRALE